MNLQKVLCEAYITLFVPNIGEDSLRHAITSLNTDGKKAQYEKFLQTGLDRLRSKQSLPSSLPAARSWKVLARQAVSEIIEPSVLDWMDDDSHTVDAEYIHRCLSELNRRYEQKYVLVEIRVESCVTFV